ncbi:MAG TPA: hypothetical protein PLO67_20930 [Saprospiraceae bacterium]|nr:hypothetical protein [Saprospiraceae bacterium]HPI08703.1 hypothetical protein [Saprospiraceae bacterium]
MAVLIILFVGMLLLLTGLLLTPLRLAIDSIRGVYQIRWYGLATLNWLPEESPDMLEMRTLFFKKRFNLAAHISQRKPAGKPAPARKSRAKPASSPRHMLKIALAILKTFRVRRCQVNWDAGDYVLNAWLFPVCFFLNRFPASVSVNFNGQCDIVLIIENSAGRLLWAFLKSSIFT